MGFPRPGVFIWLGIGLTLIQFKYTYGAELSNLHEITQS
jgi:hypothetical protein